MEQAAKHTPAEPVLLREVTVEDLPVFYEQQRDPEATAMAAFPAREWAAFEAHWTRILADPALGKRTILLGGRVAGNIGSYGPPGAREVGYWLGRAYWGRGVATRALAAYLLEEPARPLYAHVARHNIASQRVLQKCGFRVAAADEVPADVTGPAVDEVAEVTLILPPATAL